jgi:hypothetical protein
VNRGQTWTPQVSGTVLNLHAVHFANAPFGSRDSAFGCAVGADGVILWTGTGGQTWVLESSGTARSLRSVHAFGGNYGTQTVAVGDSGAVLAKDEITGGILPGTPGLPGARLWISGSRDIRIALLQPAKVTITLRDVNGKALQVLDAGLREAGEHALSLPSEPPPGLFLLEFQVDKARQVFRLFMP